MNKINLEFTSKQSEVLMSLFNKELDFIYEWAEQIKAPVDYKEVKFLEDSIILLRDSVVMNLDVVIEVQKEFRNTLIRLSSNIALMREQCLDPKNYDFLAGIIRIISDGYKKFSFEV